MKIDFSFSLINLMTKEPLMDGDKATTLAYFAINALMAQTAEDTKQTGEEKVAAYILSSKIIGGGEVEITPEESSLIKARIGKLYGPMIVGQCWPVLDGKETPKTAAVEQAAKEVANGNS